MSWRSVSIALVWFGLVYLCRDQTHLGPGELCITIGGPLGVGPYKEKREEIFQKWKDDISLLSESKNVFAKLGGLAMPVNGWNFHKEDKPASSDQILDMHSDYYHHTINCFGLNRCMFESNFPVDKRSVSYHVLWNAFKKMVKNFSEEDKNKLFFKNAKDVYGV